MKEEETTKQSKAHDLSRKQFLKTAGLGSISAAAPALLGALTTPASAQGRPLFGFRFVSNSRTATVGGVRYLAQLNGDGLITNTQVVAAGSFNLVIDTTPVPKTITSSGTWKANRLIEFELVGTYGAIASAHLKVAIDLVGSDGTVTPAVLEVNCNIAAAGLTTGEEEGYILSIPGTGFVPGGTFGPFMPFVPVAGGPPNGLTVFNLLVEQRQ